MLALYPSIEPFQTHRISVSDLHEIYVEESGNPKGVPVVVLHGGPGLGCSGYLRRFFDAERFRIILIDQRGAGRSKPLAEVADNNTSALVADIEQVREVLGVDRWLVFGFDWGATLALLYAQRNSQAVSGLIIQGVMLARRQDVDWLFSSGCNRVFPDDWKVFVSHLGEGERVDVLAAYARRLSDPNELVQIQAAKAWAGWMARCSTLHPVSAFVDHCLHPHVAISLAKLQCHYFSNIGFMGEEEVLSGMERIDSVPGVIVHGRYDVVAPLDGAFEVSNAWRGADINIIRDAGHAISEPATVDALINATHVLLDKVGPQIA